LGNDDKYTVFEGNEMGVRSLLRSLQGISGISMEWREKRGYMLVEKLAINPLVFSVFFI